MTRVWRLVGSLRMAVGVLLTIAAVLAWGTIYETSFGTASVQRFIYQAWWFQALLGFLALNLATAALQRWPWRRQHVPFVLAHIGIILILTGGILGGRFSIEGQLTIPEGQAEQTLETPGNVLVVQQPNPGVPHVVPTRFETQAWVHEPNLLLPAPLEGRNVRLVVDRYYPDAAMDEEITGDGTAEQPAVQVRVQAPDGEQEERFWLFSRDPERLGVGWGKAQIVFLEAQTDAQLTHFTAPPPASDAPRGVVSISLPGLRRPREIPVPDAPGETIPITGTAYRLTFKDYFPDFALTEQGPVSRSDQPKNPAVSFLLSGPEGTDAHLLFARHPDFPSMHGIAQKIPVEARYTHAGGGVLPPNTIALVHAPSGALLAVLTDAASAPTVIDPLEPGTWHLHPSLGYRVQVAAWHPRARITQQVANRGNTVRAEAVHVTAREGDEIAEAWIGLRQTATLRLGKEPILVDYRPGRRPLPLTVKLLDFRKTDYPGTQMAAEFESDVEVTDSRRGIILMRTIRMNQPLRYQGFSLYQASFIPGAPETTILSVRSDPGTPLVYAGFLIVIAGVVGLFIVHSPRGARLVARHNRRMP